MHERYLAAVSPRTPHFRANHPKKTRLFPILVLASTFHGATEAISACCVALRSTMTRRGTRYQSIDGSPPQTPPTLPRGGDDIELAPVNVGTADGAADARVGLDGPHLERADSHASSTRSEVSWDIEGRRSSPFGTPPTQRNDALGLTGAEGHMATISLTDMEKKQRNLIPPTTAHGPPLLKISEVDIVVPTRVPSQLAGDSARAKALTQSTNKGGEGETKRVLMKGLTFDLDAGEVLCVMGPSG